MAASLVPAGIFNRYQWKPKAPVEKSGVLRRGYWSRLRGTGWETGSFGPSQPVLKACFLVVITGNPGNIMHKYHSRSYHVSLEEETNNFQVLVNNKHQK